MPAGSPVRLSPLHISLSEFLTATLRKSHLDNLRSAVRSVINACHKRTQLIGELGNPLKAAPYATFRLFQIFTFTTFEGLSKGSVRARIGIRLGSLESLQPTPVLGSCEPAGESQNGPDFSYRRTRWAKGLRLLSDAAGARNETLSKKAKGREGSARS